MYPDRSRLLPANSGPRESASALISELALACPDQRQFRAQLLDQLDRTIGFDKASMHVFRHGSSESITCKYDVPEKFDQLPAYMAEFEPLELADASSGRPIVDIDALSSRRRDQLSIYHCILRPEKIRVFMTVMWRRGDAVSGINLARTGRGARFRAKELRVLEQLLATIRLADAFVDQLQYARDETLFEAWAADVGLSLKERAVAALVVRGLRNSEIAAILGVSPNTVRNQLASIFRKADVSTRSELVFIVTAFVPTERRANEQPRWTTFIGHSR